MAQATLFVEIVPTTKGIQRNIEKDLNGTFDTTEKKGTSVFSKIGGLAGKAALATAAAAATLTGIAIKGGFSRMLKIEDAQAKLDGLGHSAETVETIMGSALAAVKGTAYGLDTAATVAASAVAAGIKPGQELEKYLRLTADAATIAGISMDEMGSIMNKVQANGRAMTENLNQLQDRGIPILQWLAEEYGVSAEAMSEMVSKGKVDAETFNRVLQENIGGAALKSGETTRGAWANMLAALSRVGVALLEDVFPYFKDTFNGITVLLDDTAARIGPFSEAIGGAFDLFNAGLSMDAGTRDEFVGQLEGMVAAGAGVRSVFDGLRDAMAPVWAALEPLVPQIIELWSAISPLGIAMQALAPVAGTLANSLGGILAEAITTLAPPIIEIATLFGGLLAEILPTLIPVFGALIGVVAELAAALLPVVATLISALLPVFEAIIPVVLAIVEALLPFVTTLIDVLMPVIVTVADLLLALLLPVFEALTPIISAVLNVVMALLEPLLELLGPILGPLAELFTFLISAALTPLMLAFQVLTPIIVGIVEALANFLIPIINTVMTVLGGLIDFIVGVFTGDWEKAWGGIVSIFEGIFEGVVGIGKGVINLMIDIINGFIGGLNEVGSFVSDVTGGAIDFTIGKIPHLALGGIVQASAGGIPAIIGEAGYDEAVLPLGGPQLARIRNALSTANGGAEVRLIGDLHGLEKFIRAQIKTEDGWREIELSNGASF